MPGRIPLLLLPGAKPTEFVDLVLPSTDDNIFHRLIRNPHVNSETPRERECTEMLCSLLRNTTQLQSSIIRWLAEQLEEPALDLTGMVFSIDTEGSIGAKRDDLRIEGWLESDGERLALLWTIEVKIGATFHESSLQGVHEEAADDLDEANFVNQLINYDSWLRDQKHVEHRAGFVLALNDMTAELPPGLEMPWTCVTWTSLGEHLSSVLQDESLSPVEEFLAKHLLGFIRKHLWRATSMASGRIEFDDVALIRAFANMGIECERRVERLTTQLIQLVEQSGVGQGKIGHQACLFNATMRSTVSRQLFDKELAQYPYLILGVEKEFLVVFLETAPTSNLKLTVNAALVAAESRLRGRNLAWRIMSLEEKTWRDVELRMPLADLLAAKDQESTFVEFFRTGLTDLREAGVVEAIKDQIRALPNVGGLI